MGTRVAINGFARPGRMILRALVERGMLGERVQVVAIADRASPGNLAYLLQHDSIQGRFPATVRCLATAEPEDRAPTTGGAGAILVGDAEIDVIRGMDPRGLPWRALGVDVVIEASGCIDASQARGHRDAGAKRVIIAGATRGDCPALVMGANHGRYDPARDWIVSASTPSVHALAPLARVMSTEFGVAEGLVTNLRCGYESQKAVDGPLRGHWRGGRAAAVNLIPSHSGSARSIGILMPELSGKLRGLAFLVPGSGGSVVDLTVRTERSTSYPEICAAMRDASQTALMGILGYMEDGIVSADLVHCPASAVFDACSGMELNSRFFKLVAWYDARWGYACRVVDLLGYILDREV